MYTSTPKTSTIIIIYLFPFVIYRLAQATDIMARYTKSKAQKYYLHRQKVHHRNGSKFQFLPVFQLLVSFFITFLCMFITYHTHTTFVKRHAVDFRDFLDILIKSYPQGHAFFCVCQIDTPINLKIIITI